MAHALYETGINMKFLLDKWDAEYITAIHMVSKVNKDGNIERCGMNRWVGIRKCYDKTMIAECTGDTEELVLEACFRKADALIGDGDFCEVGDGETTARKMAAMQAQINALLADKSGQVDGDETPSLEVPDDLPLPNPISTKPASVGVPINAKKPVRKRSRKAAKRPSINDIA